MKNIPYITAILISFLLTTTGFSQQSEAFYYYQNQQTALQLCTEKVLLRFAEDISWEQKQRLLGQNSFLEPQYMKPMIGVDIVPVRRGVEAADLLLSLRELSANKSIAFAHPFYWIEGTDKPLSYRDDILVKLAPGQSKSSLLALAEQHKLRIGPQSLEEHGIYQLILSPGDDALAMANRLHLLPEFSFAEPNFFGEHPGHAVPPNDPELANQYPIANNGSIPAVGGIAGADMRVLDAWEYTTGCPDITIAILDDGIDLNHPDLMANLVPGFDALFVGGAGMRFPGDTHGTACAGTAAAKGDNGIGVAGVAYDCSIMPVRVFSDTFGASSASFMWGFFFAALSGADVLSNSWGWGQSNTIDFGIFWAASQGRNGKGCVILSSSGNSNNTTVGYPARNPFVIAVGAGNQCDERKRSHSSQSWIDDTLNCRKTANADPQGVSCDMDSCWGSNYGTAMELLAPGILVRTTFENNGYSWFLGTSAACPNAAGVAGLVLSANPNLSGLEVREILNTSARKLPSYIQFNIPILFPFGSWNPEVGYGVPHAENAVKEALKSITLYVQDEDFKAPPLAAIRYGEYALYAGRNVTNTLPPGNVNIEPPAPITFFQAGTKVILKAGFHAKQNTLFTARLVSNGCPVK